MKIENLILDEKDKMSLISKTEPNFHCVFINPNGIVDAEEIIKELKLNCDENDLYSEKLIIELYDNKQEAINRVYDFVDCYLDNFYVTCYKNGMLVC